MKFKLIIGFVFLWLSGSLISQEYIPMAVEGSQWIIRNDDQYTPPLVDDLWEYYASGDTCIDNECYKKVFRRELVTSYDPPPFLPDGPYELFGLIRDDTLERKVYAILIDDYGECSSGDEFLLYDFSVEIGDTVSLCLIPSFIDFVVNSITPMNYLGIETKAYTYIEHDQEYYEGLGSYYGLFEELFAPFKSANSRYIYHTFLYYYCRESPCDLVVGLPEYDNDEHALRIYPNPFTTSITIEYELYTISTIQIAIYNMMGEVVYSKEESFMPPGIHKIIWSPGHLPAGLYYAMMRSIEGVSVVKMIKE